VVFVEMLGVVKLVTPVPPVNTDPPVKAAYQSSVAPVEAVAAKPTVPVPQNAPGVLVATVGSGLMVAVTAVLAAETQPVVVLRAWA
jgi:hypothetical protein